MGCAIWIADYGSVLTCHIGPRTDSKSPAGCHFNLIAGFAQTEIMNIGGS